MARPTLFALLLCAPVLSGLAPRLSAGQTQATSPAQKTPAAPTHTTGQPKSAGTPTPAPQSGLAPRSSAGQTQATSPAQKTPAAPTHTTGQPKSSGTPTPAPQSGLAPRSSAAQTQTAVHQAQATVPHTQVQAPAAQHLLPPGMRPLEVREGRAIVQEMAWADDEEGLAPDCSHLVHHLYQKAGYPYQYVNSLDLYNGTGPFLRVRNPQPGDLIVWRGHVGIVVNAKEHSFFSSLTSGTRIEDYHSPYWRARGYPRFLRYLTSSPSKGANKTLQAANRPPDAQPKAQPERPGGGLPQGAKSSDPPSLRAVKTAPVGLPKAHGDGVPAKPRAEVASASAARADNVPQVPVLTGGLPPKAADVASALEAANLDAGEILRAANLERLERPVVVYRKLQVSSLELKGKRGTAQIQFETLATISPERMESLVGREEHQLDLQEIKRGWVIARTDQTIYVPRDSAMRILAARLASLTQSTERGTERDREQADIVRFLNLLIQ